MIQQQIIYNNDTKYKLLSRIIHYSYLFKFLLIFDKL